MKKGWTQIAQYPYAFYLNIINTLCWTQNFQCKYLTIESKRAAK